MVTLEEKYKFLLGMLQIRDADFWEGDALLCIKESKYFQFSESEADRVTAQDIDFAVEQAIAAEQWNKDHRT